MIVAKILVFSSLLLLGYVYVGYSLVLALLSRVVRGKPVAKSPTDHTVTLVISAYNEEKVIGRKLENSLELDYDKDRLEIIVVSDASTDGTDDIVRSFASRGVVLKRMPVRKGKTAGLNEAVAVARGDVLAFSDANALYSPHALTQLVRNFADPNVGCVTGDSQYTNPSRSESAKSENLYWGHERVLKIRESRLGSMVGADGAIFAIRKELFTVLETEDINDFVTPLQIVQRGYRNVFEPEAVCYESPATYFEEEFRRKIRIVNRSWNGVFRVKQLLNPLRHGWFSFQLLSHKLLRWLTAFVLILLLISSAFVLWGTRDWFYGILLGGQLIVYSVGVVGLILERSRFRTRWLSLAAYFLLINVASILGVVAGVFGKKITVWDPQREGEST